MTTTADRQGARSARDASTRRDAAANATRRRGTAGDASKSEEGTAGKASAATADSNIAACDLGHSGWRPVSPIASVSREGSTSSSPGGHVSSAIAAGARSVSRACSVSGMFGAEVLDNLRAAVGVSGRETATWGVSVDKHARSDAESIDSALAASLDRLGSGGIPSSRGSAKSDGTSSRDAVAAVPDAWSVSFEASAEESFDADWESPAGSCSGAFNENPSVLVGCTKPYEHLIAK